MKNFLVYLSFILLTSPLFASDLNDNEVTTVSFVDLEKYMGTWYEIASYPQRFQKGCTATKAKYELSYNKKRVKVTNSCRIGSVNGKEKIANGFGKVVDKKTNAKLKVTFFWPFYGDYWILGLSEHYEWAVVGSPDRESLWILSRTKTIDHDIYDEIIDSVVTRKGFLPERLVKTLQR